jgi:hypothetical protein
MEAINKITGWIVIGGAIGFILIVICLHILQAGYDPVHQLMSELALGRHGNFMFLAFFSFALSVSAVQIGLYHLKSPTIIQLFLVIAAISLFGAGVFRLDRNAEIHIAFVAIGFILIVLVMYLLPRIASVFNTPTHKIISWTLGACATICIASSQYLVPLGIGQRSAALCILMWLVWIGYSLICVRKLKAA